VTRSEALFDAARRWDVRATSTTTLVLDDGETLWITACGVPSLPSGRRMNRLDYRLWCHKHAVRCRVLALRAVRDAARAERLARYVADMRQRRGACMDCDYAEDGALIQRCEPCETLIVGRGGVPSP
jgi:hypothetical protein